MTSQAGNILINESYIPGIASNKTNFGFSMTSQIKLRDYLRDKIAILLKQIILHLILRTFQTYHLLLLTQKTSSSLTLCTNSNFFLASWIL